MLVAINASPNHTPGSQAQANLDSINFVSNDRPPETLAKTMGLPSQVTEAVAGQHRIAVALPEVRTAADGGA